MLSKISPIAFALIGVTEAAFYDLVTNRQAKADLEMNGLTLSVGETATFILKQNLSTGYGWIINEGIANGVYSVTSEDKKGANPYGMVGVPGTKEITVYGLMQGSANFQAAYVRPWMFHGWDKDMDAADTFNLKIAVKDASLAAKTY